MHYFTGFVNTTDFGPPPITWCAGSERVVMHYFNLDHQEHCKATKLHKLWAL
jgi:hypothetical protein